MTQLQIVGQQAVVDFASFDLEAYDRFIACKKVPETNLEYDWQADRYRVSMPARYASLLDPAAVLPSRDWLPIYEGCFDYQDFIVSRALHAERYAIYADCGLGKTLMFLEWARQVHAREDGKVLILSPKNIIGQTVREAQAFYGDGLPVTTIRTREELIAWLTDGVASIAITNYEKLIEGEIREMRNLAGLVLDESSILKTGGGTIKWNLIHSSKGIRYKLSCTATPAPNEVMEYASQAAFLEKLRTEGEILWTFFSKDKRGEWYIKPHAQEGFYRFLSGWSVFIRDPRTYGFKDNLKPVPRPEYIEHRIAATAEQREMAQRLFVKVGAGMFGDRAMGVKERSKLSQIAKGFQYEKDGSGRKAIPVPSLKPATVAKIAADEVAAGNQVLVWTVFDEESDILSSLIVGGVTLTGDTPDRERDRIIAAFQAGQIPVLIAKPQMLGYGFNFQSAGATIFSGWNDSFEQFYQAVRRLVRYGQTRSVRVHIPFIPELEGMILENVLQKQASYERDAALQEEYFRKALMEAAA